KALTADMIAAIGDQIYTGKVIEPKLTVTDGTPSILAAADYTVAYQDNTNVGTATVTVTATANANYSGTASKNFQIIKANADVSVTADKNSYTYGDAITLTVNVKMAKVKSAALNEVEFFCGKTSLGTASVTPKDATSGTATLTVKTTDKKIAISAAQIITAVYGGNKSLNEKTGTVTVTINPKELTVSSIAEATKEYDNSNVFEDVTILY
ncbi:MAG: hypothetical protein RR709_10640, partial [Ruthenibacterium sp.]